MKKRISVVSIKMVKDRSVLYEPRQVTRPKDAVRLCRDFIGDVDREELLVVTLDNQNQFTSVNICSRGTLNMTVVEMRDIFKTAILSNSAKLLVAHNHTSDSVSPSMEDIELTERIKNAGKIMGIELIDHLIVSNDKYYSFKENDYV